MKKIPIAIGDIHGCHSDFLKLCKILSIKEDTPLWITGDIINKGPDSLKMIHTLMSLGSKVVVVLGNHELHLLAVSAGIFSGKPGDKISQILRYPKITEFIEWIRYLPFVHYENSMIMVHAGLLPQWDINNILELSYELQKALRANTWKESLKNFYENSIYNNSKTFPSWNPNLKKIDQLRIAFNAFTRIRFCSKNGIMNFSKKGKPNFNDVDSQYIPWFDIPDRKTKNNTVIFGHWSELGLFLRKNIICLDSGCVWGKKLSAVTLEKDPNKRIVRQVRCSSSI